MLFYAMNAVQSSIIIAQIHETAISAVKPDATTPSGSKSLFSLSSSSGEEIRRLGLLLRQFLFKLVIFLEFLSPSSTTTSSFLQSLV